MKNIFILTAFLAISILGSCSDASTAPTKKEFPTYKYSFTGTISNPKNITIPDDAYLSLAWLVSKGDPDYGYYYGEGYIDKATNSFTIGFNEEIPSGCLNLNDSSSGGLGVASVALLTSKTKIAGKYTKEIPQPDYKIYGAMNYSGFVYIAGEPAKVEWIDWAGVFQKGYNFATGVQGDKRGHDYFIPADTKDMVLLIDTSRSSFSYPDWTGINPIQANSK